MATPAIHHGSSQMAGNHIDKGKAPARPPEDSPGSVGGSETFGTPDLGYAETPPGQFNSEFESAQQHQYTTNGGAAFAGSTHPGLRNLGGHDPRTEAYDLMDDDSSDDEEAHHGPRLDTSRSWSDQSVGRAGGKEPMSAILEEESSDEEEAGAVQTAQVGRMHSLKGKSSTPIIVSRGFGNGGNGVGRSGSSSSNGEARSPGSDRSGNEKNADANGDIEKLMSGNQRSHIKEGYRIHYDDKDFEKSGQPVAVRMALRSASPDLPEVVPSHLEEKEAFRPSDDKIPRPRHDEKIPAPRFDDKILSPNSGAPRGILLNDSGLSTSQADEKLLPLYTGFEENLGGGSYFVGTIDNLSGSNNTDGRPPLKIAADSTILVPQPSDDPNDPLNWSWLKKHSTYWVILLTSFLSDLVVTYGIVLYNNQAYEWSRTTTNISHSVAGAILLQAPGALFIVPVTQRFGRLPVLFWSQFLTLIATLAATYCRTFTGFQAMRAIQGFFAVAPQVIGLSVIYDLFFFHERARKLNTWLCFTFLGPYMGVFVSTLVVDKLDWRDTFAILCGFYGFSLVAVAFFAEETLFNARNPWPGSGGAAERVMYVTGFVGIMQKRGRSTAWQSCKHICQVIVRPYVVVPIFALVTCMAVWLEGIISVMPKLMKPQPYSFSTQNMAMLCFAPFVGIILAEIWGRWFNDFLTSHYVRRHRGMFKPEFRLWAVYPASLLGIVGLCLFGQAFHLQLQWGVVAISWALTTFSALGVTVAITTYLLDVMTFHAAAVAAWIVVFRSLGGWAAPYILAHWSRSTDIARMYGVQAAAWGFCVIFIIITQIQGAKWRAKFPVPKPMRQNF